MSKKSSIRGGPISKNMLYTIIFLGMLLHLPCRQIIRCILPRVFNGAIYIKALSLIQMAYGLSLNMLDLAVGAMSASYVPAPLKEMNYFCANVSWLHHVTIHFCPSNSGLSRLVTSLLVLSCALRRLSRTATLGFGEIIRAIITMPTDNQRAQA